jgi:signal transduction histidine kinase
MLDASGGRSAGGRVAVDDNDGGGARFTIELPLTPLSP